MSGSERERNGKISGHFDRQSSSQSGRDVLLAWCGIAAGVVLLYGVSHADSPGRNVAEEPQFVHTDASGTFRVRRLPPGPPDAASGPVNFEFINQSGKTLPHVAVVIRETDPLNRLVRDHRESADSLSAGRRWIFKVQPMNPENTLTVLEMGMN